MLGRTDRGEKAALAERSVAIQSPKASSWSLTPSPSSAAPKADWIFITKGKNRGQVQANKEVGHEEVRFGEDGAQMLSGVNISTRAQPPEKGHKATEGATGPWH